MSKKANPKPEPSYFEQRIFNELGVAPEQNRIKLKFFEPENNTTHEIDYDIFSEDEEGNIKITPFTINRELIQYDNQKATPTIRNIHNARKKVFYITRFKTPQEYTDKKGQKQVKKYDFPKGAATTPFITPGLCEKYETIKKIETLVLTEGYFKAFKGWLHGLDIVGLSSISHYKQKDTETMYTDVIKLIQVCQVENVIILYDGDARDISLKDLQAKRELRRRPLQFVNSARNIRELLKDYNVDVYFAAVNSAEIKGNPKGLDDLYIARPNDADEITKDLLAFSRPTVYFWKHNIRHDLGKLYKFFCLDTVENFHGLHSQVIQTREFVYNGTTYLYNPDKGTCDIKVPGEASNYFRVGDDYYKFVLIPNKYNQNEKKFLRRLKSTITEDHGKKLLPFVPKYEAFCNVPDHVNFQQVINNCFNIYAPIEYEPEAGEWETIKTFIKHIFQEQYELGLDYLQLLYQKPYQTLPILCLVSKENNTGKSTFIKFAKAIFGQNATVIGNEDLANGFNSFWVAKLVIGIEETFVDKKSTTERIKALATADKITMNAKGRDQVEIDFFGKFILASNNEDNFIYASREDIRYWVRKVPKITGKVDVKMMEHMIDEIPAFLQFLNERKLSTKDESRMWFNENLLRTEALEKLVQNSRPSIEKEIYEFVKSVFFEFGESEVYLTPKDINNLILSRKQETSYLTRILRENMGVLPYHNADGKEVVKAYSIPYWGQDNEGDMVRKEHTFKGRPYVFRAVEILNPADLETWNNIQAKEEQEPQPTNPPKPEIPENLQSDLPF
jgi:galactitol-specific phosphotransferase system IIB component